MSARFLHSPAIRDWPNSVSAALLVALAMNPSASVCYDLVDLGDAPHDSHAETPPGTQTWTSNSVGLLQAAEEGQKEPTYVPLFLHPNSFVANVNRTALQPVFNAFTENLSDSKIQQLINDCFPANDFSQHLFTHLRVFLAGKPFLKVSVTPMGKRRSASKLEPAPSKILDGETTVALKQIELAQRWFAVHFRTVAQIMRASLLFGSRVSHFALNGAFVLNQGAKADGLAFSAFTLSEMKELHAMSDHFEKAKKHLILITKALKAKLDSISRKEWQNYARGLGFKMGDEWSPFLQVQRRLHFITWALNSGPPIFFANHRNEFAEVADLLTQYGGETDGPSTHLLKNLSFLGRAMRDLSLTAEDLEPFEDHCNALVAHEYWIAPNTPFVGGKPE
eukprot:Blabericola_migrator_1__5643@NODE_2867_length_2263_cov_29_032787_g1799_i0_p1_GENE_NODE_2867_length_2263_cov_29_032787_g1799_i0NODE_2867_length_2263_cov_29_032787_g1799_i0_p1_ORF_typecomplete_len393_score61_09HIT/PF01230_23/9_1e02HIT/PF01230_23/1_6_NODE_2867_length_2263_cov_29_032787_g1799_i02621440